MKWTCTHETIRKKVFFPFCRKRIIFETYISIAVYTFCTECTATTPSVVTSYCSKSLAIIDGGIYKVQRTGNTITYLVNDVVFHTSATVTCAGNVSPPVGAWVVIAVLSLVGVISTLNSSLVAGKVNSLLYVRNDNVAEVWINGVSQGSQASDNAWHLMKSPT
jgi:hypothetical protein